MSKSAKISTSKNHERAPEMAKFVKQMRELFGDDLKVTWVKEGDFEIGQPLEDDLRRTS